jgi:hypothetical protein
LKLTLRVKMNDPEKSAFFDFICKLMVNYVMVNHFYVMKCVFYVMTLFFYVIVGCSIN